jgi:hypothetical protein
MSLQWFDWFPSSSAPLFGNSHPDQMSKGCESHARDRCRKLILATSSSCHRICAVCVRILSISSISIHFIHVHSLKWGSFRVPTSGQHTHVYRYSFKQFPVECLRGCLRFGRGPGRLHWQKPREQLCLGLEGPFVEMLWLDATDWVG